MAGGDGIAQHLVDGGREPDRAIGDGRGAGLGLREADAVFSPTAALGAGVEKHRLKTVAGVSKFCFGCGAGFELVPERAEFAGLIDGEQTENAIGGAGFAVVLARHRGGVVGKGVAGVDFDEVVDEAHLQHAKHIEVRDIGVFGEDHDAEAKRPRVLGVIFGAAARNVDGLAEDFLQFITLSDEGDLLRKPSDRMIAAHGLR